MVSKGRYCIWSKQTVEKVKSCPASIFEWERRKEIRKCSLLAQNQNCTDVSNFEYHCVIDESGKALIEVCASAYIINGDTVERWRALKHKTNAKTDNEMADMLIERLSIDISTHESKVDADEEDDDDDPDYRPSFDITSILSDDMNNIAEDVPFEELELGYMYEVPGNDGVLEDPYIDKEIQPGIQKVLDDDGCRQLTTATKCIAFTN